MTDTSRPKFLSKNAIKTIIETEDTNEIQDLLPVLQILTVKDVRSKKNMKDKLHISDGVHKMLCIVKDKINTSEDKQYKVMDIIKLNKFQIKEVGKVKVIIPSTDFEIITSEVEDVLGQPKDYSSDSDDSMEVEIEIPYKTTEKPVEKKLEAKVEAKEELVQKDVEMKATPEKKVEEDKEELPDASPSPVKQEAQPEENDDDDIYTPIKALSPMNSDWIIKARVSKKYPVKEWTNARGSGKLLNFELVDKHGVQIQATIFNKAVEKFDPILEQDKVYIFCKGQVKIANQKFTAIKNDYSLTFNPYSEITVTDDDSSISKTAFNF